MDDADQSLEIKPQSIDPDLLVDAPMSAEDVRALVGLLGRIAGMTEPLLDRRRALMDELVTLIGARSWMWSTSTGFGPGEVPMTVGYQYGGLTDRQIGMIIEHSQDPDNEPLENAPMSEALAPGKHVTRSRRDLVADEELYASPQWEMYRKPIGMDHFLFSLYPVGKYVSAIGVHRPIGAPDFTPRERRMVHVVVSQIDWLHRVDVPEGDGERTTDLSPRLRVVFALLLQGWNRKRIAEHLGLTANTVAGYQKQIYRNFGVSSHPELLVRFVRGDGGDTPG